MEPNLAYNLAAWNSFFTGVTAADGALLGLMITALTVRITLIETHPRFTARAYVLLAVLFDVLASAIFPLAPINRLIISVLFVGWGGDALRNFLIYLFEPSWLMFSRRPKGSSNDTPEPPPKPAVVWPFFLSPFVIIPLGPVPMIISGVSLAVRRGGGLYWAAAGLVMTLGFALTFLWGLMIERYGASKGAVPNSPPAAGVSDRPSMSPPTAASDEPPCDP